MEDRDYELISKMADQAYNKAQRAKTNAEVWRDRASKAAEMKDFPAANHWNRLAAANLNDYFYWIGHHNAYKGIAAGLALREVVETELDETPSCP